MNHAGTLLLILLGIVGIILLCVAMPLLLTIIAAGRRIRLGLVAAYKLPCLAELVRDMQFFHNRDEISGRQEQLMDIQTMELLRTEMCP